MMDRTKLLHNGWLVLLTAAVGLAMALNRHNTVVLGALGVLGTILIPLSYVLLRRFLHGLRQRETEARMLSQTREFLRNQEPWSPLRDAPKESADEAVQHANASASRIAPRGFKDVFAGALAPLPKGNPVSFGALTRPSPAGTYYEPALVTMLLSEPLAETVGGQGSGS